MATEASSKPPSVVSGPLGSPVSIRHRRDSITSISVASAADKEQLAEALDKIHTSARGCDTLTTFKDFAPPPSRAPSNENKPSPGDIVQQGFSGLYSRFREAVGVGNVTKPNTDDDRGDIKEHKRGISSESTHASRPSTSTVTRSNTSGTLSSTIPTLPTPMTEITASELFQDDSRSQTAHSTKSGSISLMPGSKLQSSRQAQPTKATSVVAVEPTIAPPRMNREPSRSTIHTDHSGDQSSSRRSGGKANLQSHLSGQGSVASSEFDPTDTRLPPISKHEDTSSLDGNRDGSQSPQKTTTPSLPPMESRHMRTPSGTSSLLSPDSIRRTPAVIDRISRSRSPAHSESRGSSKDRATSDRNALTLSTTTLDPQDYMAHGSRAEASSADIRIPGTMTSSGRASDQLEKMRRQVISKEFWMKDDTVKECFMCQTPFTAFRRKHHCRTCGCIFDSKCTTVISGERFGVAGTLRVCKRCLEVITRRFDGSGSEDSGDEQSFMPSFFGHHRNSPSTASQTRIKEAEYAVGSEGSEDTRPLSTPLMTIPATRRMKDANRQSAVLEIGAPQLSRPGSSRSLKSLNSGRPPSSAGHKRHHSKHGYIGGRYRPSPHGQAPFRKGIEEESLRKNRLPVFHDDNIIDPDLADYMSDDSSGEEQSSIFGAMVGAEKGPGSLEHERSNFGAYMGAGRRHRRGETSISGMSHFSRGPHDDVHGPASLVHHRKSTRRRNMSNVSGSANHLPSPRPKSMIFPKPGASSEMLFSMENPSSSALYLPNDENSQDLRKQARIVLNQRSLDHINKLLTQLLEDARVPNIPHWQKALTPILLEATDDVSPDVKNGESMDITHFVKLKRIPGGKAGDSSYISGVVFTKNLALKTMPRRAINPRIVLITFPLEYQRHQQHFMSLQPVIKEEKEFLRVVVQRIIHLRPQVLLAEKSISGVALQLLSDANISVAYNVKHTVIEAVSRCAETSIISSVDMLALPVTIGKCSGFEVRTFVNNDYPGRKKSYIFLSGCRPDLGCTISLRGADSATLGKVKQITELMIYVVYNLKLESSLLKDEAIEPIDDADRSLSNSQHDTQGSFRSVLTAQGPTAMDGPAVVFNQPESEPPSQTTMDGSSIAETDESPSLTQSGVLPPKGTNLISLHDTHAEISQDGHVPDDVPMPTFYSDLVAIYDTKILSASPYVKFTMPYPLIKAREQERRLEYLKRLRDQDIVYDKDDSEKSARQKFHLITPEMVEEMGQKAPRKVMEVLHAVHDAEYDKAFFNYHNQTRQWETYVHGNVDLLDPWSHQNIVVLFSMVCTETKIPCVEPETIGMEFYDEQHNPSDIDPDICLGHYVIELLQSRNELCNENGCERPLYQHHRTYVHDKSRVTVFVENTPSKGSYPSEYNDSILMWHYCKICNEDSEAMPMSDATFKYSFGKYLELLFWGQGLQTKSTSCRHDHRRDHIRYFGVRDCRVRIHWDPVELLEIVVPRARITWKVANDLRLKNEIYCRAEDRWAKFMASIRARLKSIRIDSVLPDKAELCQAELDALRQRVHAEQPMMVRKLQDAYVQSKYYAIVPFNKVIREMLVKAGEWDQIFTKFEADYLGDKDMRQLTMMQLKKMFTDNDSKESLATTEGTGSSADTEEKGSQIFSETDERSTQPTEYTTASEDASLYSSKLKDEKPIVDEPSKSDTIAETADQEVEKLPVPAETTSTIKSQLSVGVSDDGGPQRPPVPESPTNASRIPVSINGPGLNLSQKIEQKRLENSLKSTGVDADAETEPEAKSSRKEQRKSISAAPPPSMVRSASQASKDVDNVNAVPEPKEVKEGKADKSLSDRIGLTALKNRNKKEQSAIPRPTKKRDSKVSTLARHFEQLSREFEKERIRDRKARAAKARQPRAILSRSKTKATVDVYDDVNEAFEEPGPEISGEAIEPKATASSEVTLQSNEKTEEDVDLSSSIHNSSGNANRDESEDEGIFSDPESRLSEDLLPDIQDLADSLPAADIPDELPKHQRTSLMKYLTNFWAERGASNWASLEYPLNPTDHIFADSDIIVREDEPSSVIAMALNSEHYNQKLGEIRSDVHQLVTQEKQTVGEERPEIHITTESDEKNGLPLENEKELEMPPSTKTPLMEDGRNAFEACLLQATGTHLRYQFRDGSAIMTCKIFYAEQFDALRRTCHVDGRIVESLSRCMKWDSRGGKTKSVFLKTLDDRFVLKVSNIEHREFL